MHLSVRGTCPFSEAHSLAQLLKPLSWFIPLDAHSHPQTGRAGFIAPFYKDAQWHREAGGLTQVVCWELA